MKLTGHEHDIFVQQTEQELLLNLIDAAWYCEEREEGRAYVLAFLANQIAIHETTTLGLANRILKEKQEN